ARTKITPRQVQKLCEAPGKLGEELIELSDSEDEEAKRSRRLYSSPDAIKLVAQRDSALLHTLASSGLKTAEVAKLKTSQVVDRNDHYAIIIPGKRGGKRHEAPLSK